MINNRNIVCFSNILWEGDYAKTIAELMRVFAEKNTVLYVDNAYTIKDVLDTILGKKAIPLKRAFGLQSRLRKIKINENTYVYTLTPPIALTINFLPNGFVYKQLLKFNGWLVRATAKKYLRQLNMNKDLINIVAFNPAIGVTNGRKLNEKLLLYHCYDIIEAANWLKKHGVWLEKEFMQIADAVIVTSQGLYEKKKSFCKACFLVKNAANIELFNEGFNPVIAEKKTIGYIGSIDDRLDYSLLEFIVGAMPEVDFVFVGRIIDKSGEKILRKYSNVKLTGAKAVHELPEYIKHFSLGIIPFAKNEFNKGIYPLKINEYLAAGIPVVTTNFSYLDEFEEVVRIADTDEEFNTFIKDELLNDSIEKKKARVEVAKQNSWEHRVDELSDIITILEKDKLK